MAEAKGRSIAGRVKLVGAGKDEEAPRLGVSVIDESGKRLASVEVDADGSFTLPARARNEAARAFIGPADLDPAEEPDRFLRYRVGDLERQLSVGPLALPIDRWKPWLWWNCVSGSIRRCMPFPHWIRELAVSGTAPLRLGDLSPVEPLRVFYPWRCSTVCQGRVEVYQRTCCCTPPVVFEPPDFEVEWPEEPPIPDPPIPDPPWPPEPDPWPPIPPGPGPDPMHLASLNDVATSGALDARKLNASRDAVALRTLTGRRLTEYIRLRPYLWCTCGGATKVAEGMVADDGTFSICWRGWPFAVVAGCRTEYAYKVSQPIDGVDVTIYDGVAAGQWFDPGDSPNLTSYSPLAVTCVGEPEIPGTDDAIVLLHEIGATEAHHLSTPSQDTPDSVGAPGASSGLLDAAATDGPWVNRPLGGTLGLRYFFSSGMKGVGARFFRVQVAAADGSGNPAGTWATVPVPIWRTWRWTGTEWLRGQHALGPNAAGLYVIPYQDVDLLASLEEWDPDQYHGVLDTTGFSNGRHLIRIEVFDDAGNQIRPTGSTGTGTVRPFRFGLWRIPAGPPDNVPYSALTHLLWWDNRAAVAAIEAIRLNSAPSSAMCQFLEGPAGSTVSFDIRAYHPNAGSPLFLLDHGLSVVKGLSGPGTTFIGNAFGEVGEPPSAAFTSPTKTLGDLLGTDVKCAFAVNLSARVKTTNGAGRLIGLDRHVTAAFAAEQT
jgi:hypothetical protein